MGNGVDAEGRLIRAVAFYVFDTPSGELKLERSEWWNGALTTDPEWPGYTFVILNPDLRYLDQPTFEELVCGHRKPADVIKSGPFKGRVGYRLRRLCRECAARRSIAKMRLENIRRLAG